MQDQSGNVWKVKLMVRLLSICWFKYQEDYLVQEILSMVIWSYQGIYYVRKTYSWIPRKEI